MGQWDRPAGSGRRSGTWRSARSGRSPAVANIEGEFDGAATFFERIDMGISGVGQDDVGVLYHRGGDVGVEVQSRHDRGRGTDEAAHVGEEGAFGIGLILGDHRAVEEQDHARKWPGTARRSTEPIEQPVAEGLMRLGSNQATGHRGGKKCRHLVGAGIGGSGKDATKHARGAGALGEDCLSSEQGPLAEGGQVGLDGPNVFVSCQIPPRAIRGGSSRDGRVGRIDVGRCDRSMKRSGNETVRHRGQPGQ